MDLIARIFGAVADPTRLAVLTLLQRHGERCVCEIHAILGVSPSRASRALKELRLAGLVTDRRVGTWIHYRLPAAPGALQGRLIDAVAAMVPESEAAALDEKLRAHHARKADGCTAPTPGVPAPLAEGVRP